MPALRGIEQNHLELVSGLEAMGLSMAVVARVAITAA